MSAKPCSEKIELGKSIPSITVLRAADAKLLRTSDGSFESRALFPFNGSRKVEFYELRVEGGYDHCSLPHSAATTEDLTVARGELD